MPWAKALCALAELSIGQSIPRSAYVLNQTIARIFGHRVGSLLNMSLIQAALLPPTSVEANSPIIIGRDEIRVVIRSYVGPSSVSKEYQPDLAPFGLVPQL